MNNLTVLFGLVPLWDRTLPVIDGSTPAVTEGPGGTSLGNLVLIVGLALVITFLARYLATRGRRKK